MSGESLLLADTRFDGFVGDRSWGVVDTSTGRLLSAKTVPQLLGAVCRVLSDNDVEIAIPGQSPALGSDPLVHDVLSKWLQRAVRLQQPEQGRSAEIDIEVDMTERGGPENQLFTFQSKPGLFFDGTPMHVLTTASVAAMAARYPAGVWSINRFRPNIVVEAESDTESFPEDDWVGHSLTIGSATIDVHKRCDRCVLTTRAFPDAPADRGILQALHREHGGDLGVKATITAEGIVSIGDTITLH